MSLSVVSGVPAPALGGGTVPCSAGGPTMTKTRLCKRRTRRRQEDRALERRLYKGRIGKKFRQRDCRRGGAPSPPLVVMRDGSFARFQGGHGGPPLPSFHRSFRRDRQQLSPPRSPGPAPPVSPGRAPDRR